MKQYALVFLFFTPLFAFSQSRKTPKHHAAHVVKTNQFSGLASWYGTREQGHKMANGEKFDRHAFTAASRTLPFGTHIHVVNQANHLSTDVIVTDRGPWCQGRILDLAEAPAESIGCIQQGVCKVSITIVKDDDPNG